MRRELLLGVGAVLAAVLVISAALYVSSAQTTSTMSPNPGGSSTQSTTNSISVSGLSICPSDCVYPAPYVSALVLVNSTSPLSSLTVYVNGTFDAVPIQHSGTESNTLTTFGYEYKGSVPNAFIPIVAGDTYKFTFVAEFQDGTAYTATTYAQGPCTGSCLTA